MPEYHCNRYIADAKSFAERTNDTPTDCVDQCKGYEGEFLYTSMHPCDPYLCDDNAPDVESPANIYKGELVNTQMEIDYDSAKFAKFEVTFLFVLFILINSWQALNSGCKIVKKASGNMAGFLIYMVTNAICVLTFQIILIKYFPNVFFFQFQLSWIFLKWFLVVFAIIGCCAFIYIKMKTS